MPEITRFYGIVIKMFFKPKEHEPSHIHALYGEYMGEFNIQTNEMIQGDLPMKAQKMVTEWLEEHRDELPEMWDTQKNPEASSPYLRGEELRKGGSMIYRIKSIRPLPDYMLHVIFDDGKDVLYDVKDDIQTLEGYKDLENITGLFQQVQLDQSRTCVFWNDYIDLPSDAIYEYGIERR